ncbi:hypothetical protein MVEN_01652000 [Mycena venus]|uniref:F-box domain-containing protein n=1 Tax=Mycena venus TaxID=2733690 RepID=A0A8H6XQS7_9AGAR|nr:hypothetical protein MVEN_01652000 [Mycena venus]
MQPVASRCVGDPPALELLGFSFLFGDEANQTVDPTTALVDLWLTRSRGYPLSVTIRCREPGFRLPYGLISVLKNRSSQWARLELKLSWHDFSEFSKMSAPFPCLQALAMDCNNSQMLDNFAWNNELYSSTHSPGLTSLRLGYCAGVYPLYPFTAASSQLTTLEDTMRDSASAMVVFDLFPRLRYLILHVDYPLLGAPSPAVVPVTAHLTCLILDGNVDLLGCLHPLAPASRRDHLERGGFQYSCVVRGTLAMRANALHLLHGSFISPEIRAALFPVAVTVPTLELDNKPFVHGDLRILFPREGLLFSRLQILSIVAYDFPNLYDDFLKTLSTLLTVRCAHLRIACGHSEDPAADIPPPPDYVLAHLGDFAREGMVITLETPTYRWPENFSNDLDGDYNVFDPEERLPSSIFCP